MYALCDELEDKIKIFSKVLHEKNNTNYQHKLSRLLNAKLGQMLS